MWAQAVPRHTFKAVRDKIDRRTFVSIKTVTEQNQSKQNKVSDRER